MGAMSERYEELLYTDFAGNTPPASGGGVDAVIVAGLADSRRHQRVPELIEMVDDPGYDPLERYDALRALATWAEPTGLRAVATAARTGRGCPWYGADSHRIWDCDVTFEGLAQSVNAAAALVTSEATAELRHTALLELLELADTEYFESSLALLIVSDLTDDVAASVDRAITRATSAWRAGRRPPFPLLAQAADLAVTLLDHDEALAVARADEIVDFGEFDMRTLTGLVEIVATGSDAVSTRFAQHLLETVGPAVQPLLDEALEDRHDTQDGSRA